MVEIRPPWIEHPGYPPSDMFWRQTGESWYFDVWVPHWQSLKIDEKQAYLDRWNVPQEWLLYSEEINPNFKVWLDSIWNTPKDIQKLIEYLDQGSTFEYIFFWESQGDGVDKNCLSQFFRAPFTIDEVTYPTAEHYMMAEKARLFNDEESLQKILKTSSPFEVKKLGRQIKSFDDANWDTHRFNIVIAGNLAKFEQNSDLQKFLLDTKDKILVEASPFDTVWGIGLSKNDPGAHEPRKWKGLNLLGFALMKVRDDILIINPYIWR